MLIRSFRLPYGEGEIPNGWTPFAAVNGDILAFKRT